MTRSSLSSRRTELKLSRRSTQSFIWKWPPPKANPPSAGLSISKTATVPSRTAKKAKLTSPSPSLTTTLLTCSQANLTPRPLSCKANLKSKETCKPPSDSLPTSSLRAASDHRPSYIQPSLSLTSILYLSISVDFREH